MLLCGCLLPRLARPPCDQSHLVRRGSLSCVHDLRVATPHFHLITHKAYTLTALTHPTIVSRRRNSGHPSLISGFPLDGVFFFLVLCVRRFERKREHGETIVCVCVSSRYCFGILEFFFLPPRKRRILRYGVLYISFSFFLFSEAEGGGTRAWAARWRDEAWWATDMGVHRVLIIACSWRL